MIQKKIKYRPFSSDFWFLRPQNRAPLKKLQDIIRQSAHEAIAEGRYRNSSHQPLQAKEFVNVGYSGKIRHRSGVFLAMRSKFLTLQPVIQAAQAQRETGHPGQQLRQCESLNHGLPQSKNAPNAALTL